MTFPVQCLQLHEEGFNPSSSQLDVGEYAPNAVQAAMSYIVLVRIDVRGQVRVDERAATSPIFLLSRLPRSSCSTESQTMCWVPSRHCFSDEFVLHLLANSVHGHNCLYRRFLDGQTISKDST